MQTKKQELVRTEIWKAAVNLFYSAGFENVTVEQIASEAGISRRTFFRYFSSKEDLMSATIRSYGAALEEAIARQKAGASPLESAKLAVSEVLAPHFPSETTERVIHVGRRSPAARSAQYLAVSEVEDRLAGAFSLRAKRKGIRSLQDRILASITLSATQLCSTTWVEQQDRPMLELIDEVFREISQLSK
ncbi:TetR/AcrR family transcriptional regulator [Granulicella sibirica]|nr:TetR family transcriptional regulator [Granulicella sibirica]